MATITTTGHDARKFTPADRAEFRKLIAGNPLITKWRYGETDDGCEWICVWTGAADGEPMSISKTPRGVVVHDERGEELDRGDTLADAFGPVVALKTA